MNSNSIKSVSDPVHKPDLCNTGESEGFTSPFFFVLAQIKKVPVMQNVLRRVKAT